MFFAFQINGCFWMILPKTTMRMRQNGPCSKPALFQRGLMPPEDNDSKVTLWRALFWCESKGGRIRLVMNFTSENDDSLHPLKFKIAPKNGSSQNFGRVYRMVNDYHSAWWFSLFRCFTFHIGFQKKSFLHTIFPSSFTSPPFPLSWLVSLPLTNPRQK